MQKVASNVKTTAEETVTKRAVYIPDTYVLVLGFVVMAVLLTHLIPAGSYDTITDAGTGRQVIDPTSFQHISATPVGLMAFLLSLSRGMVEGSTVIFLVFLVGGYFQIISDTGAIDAAIGAAVRKLQDRSLLVIPFLTVMMAGLGSLGITN